MKLGLRSKLVVGVFIYLGLLSVVGLLGLYAAQVSLNGMHSALEHNVRELSLLAKLGPAAERVQSTVLLHVLTESAAEQAAYEAQIADLEREIDGLFDQEVDLQRSFGDQADVDRFEELRADWRDYLHTLDERFLPLSREDRDADALAVAREDGPVDLAYERAVAQLTNVQAAVEAESREQLERAEQQFAWNRTVLMLALALAGGFGTLFGLWQSSRLAAAVRAVSRAARRVSQGDFGQHLHIQTGDEIESLAESFNVMTANLQRMNDERRAVERMKDEFVSMVSHELRTPLNGVIGMTDLLLQADLGPQARTYADSVQRSGEVLLAIVDDILDLSKIEAGKLDLDSAPLDVRQVVAEGTQFFTERAASKGVELTWSVDAAVPDTVHGDQMRLRQVLLNLVGNALKFTEVGGVRLRVELADTTPEAAVVRFEVADTGIGIDARARERLFEPFSQGDSSMSRKYGGTGLGLSICQRLVKLMGGSIGVHSQPGEGSVFWFSIPFASGAAAADEPPAPALPQVAETVPAVRSPRRILLVEDSWMNQQVALGMLERLGYQADVVSDGRQALEAIERTSYAAVLLDCQMPEMDGYQVAAELRRREARDGRQPVPVIALTASVMAADRERCLASGMNDHLAKPVRMAGLSAILARWAPCTPARRLPRPRANAPVGCAQRLSADSPLESPRGGTSSAASRPPTPLLPLSQRQEGERGPRGDEAEPMPAEVFDAAALAAVARLQRPGRRDLVAAIVERFQADAPRHLDTLREAATRGDTLALSQCAHRLKGDSRRIGGNEVGQLCAQIEALGRSGALEGVSELIAALDAALERLSVALRAVSERRPACAS